MRADPPSPILSLAPIMVLIFGCIGCMSGFMLWRDDIPTWFYIIGLTHAIALFFSAMAARQRSMPLLFFALILAISYPAWGHATGLLLIGCGGIGLLALPLLHSLFWGYILSRLFVSWLPIWAMLLIGLLSSSVLFVQKYFGFHTDLMDNSGAHLYSIAIAVWHPLAAIFLYYAATRPLPLIFAQHKFFDPTICAVCGYSRIGLPINEPCPECGTLYRKVVRDGERWGTN